MLSFATQHLLTALIGPEKLLEVWFAPSPDDIGSTEPTGLKAVNDAAWEGMLDLVNCKILSIVESEDVDAYLLSESSMFVFPHKLILKTCGTTTLLWGLPRILEIAATLAGFPKSTAPPSNGIATAAAPYRVFYSRKNFQFPDRQRGPHRSWKDEVKAMDNLFLGGSAYMIGKMNGEHWYLYLTEPFTSLTPPSTPGETTETKVLEFPEKSAQVGRKRDDNDETLEMLMTDLEEENAKQFYLDHASAVARDRYHNLQQGKNGNGEVLDVDSETGVTVADEDDELPPELTTEGHALGTVVTETCGLADIYPAKNYPDSRIDAYLFTPCGFSANGVVPAPDGVSETHYFTVHVTPEPHCSYASFETNVPQFQKGRETTDIINQVVGIFKPGRFSVTLFEAKPVVDDPVDIVPTEDGYITNEMRDEIIKAKAKERDIANRNAKMDNIPGYRRVDRIVHDLDGYDLVFRYYERNDWKGGAPRIGEHVL